MKKLLLLSLLILGCASPAPVPFVPSAVAELPAVPKYSLDLLGAAKFPDEAISATPREFGVGLFTGRETFGDGMPVVRRLLTKGVPLIRLNLKWSDSHSFSTRDFPGIVSEAARFGPLFEGKTTNCRVSGATEHQLSAKDAKDLALRVLAVLPQHCIYVNQPYGRGAFISGPRIINEVHGPASRVPSGPYSFSYDGTDAFDSNNTADKQKFNKAETFFFWTSQFNLRFNRNDKTPRDKRRAIPSEDLIRASAYLAKDRGAVSVPSQLTLKPKSDQHQIPAEGRALKPVFIIPGNVGGDRLTLKRGGYSITSSKAEAYADGRNRYYFPEYGFKITNKAGGNLDLIGRGKKLGTVNPAFRSGKQ